MVIGIAKAALFRTCDRRAKSGEEYDIVGILLEDVLRSFL